MKSTMRKCFHYFSALFLVLQVGVGWAVTPPVLSISHSPGTPKAGQSFSITWSATNASSTKQKVLYCYSDGGFATTQLMSGSGGTFNFGSDSSWAGKTTSCALYAYYTDDVNASGVYDSITFGAGTPTLTPPALSLGACSSGSATAPSAATGTCSLSNTGQTAASGISYSGPAGATVSGPSSCAANSSCGTVTVRSGTQAGSYSGSVVASPSAGSAGSSSIALTVNAPVVVTPAPTISVWRSMAPLIAGRSYTTSWATTNATSLSFSCSASGSGFAGSAPITPMSGTAAPYVAPSAWVGYPTTCVWTASGPGGTTQITEGFSTVAEVTPPALSLSSCSNNTGTTSPSPASMSCTLSNTGGTAASSISYGVLSGVTVSGPTGSCAASSTCGQVTVTTASSAGSYVGTLTATPNAGTAASSSINLQVLAPPLPAALSISNCASTSPVTAPNAASMSCTVSNTGGTAVGSITYSALSGMTVSGPTGYCAANSQCGSLSITTQTTAKLYTGTLTATPNTGSGAAVEVSLRVTNSSGLQLQNCSSTSPVTSPAAASMQCTLSNATNVFLKNIQYSSLPGMTVTGPSGCDIYDECGTVNITTNGSAGNYSGVLTVTTSPYAGSSPSVSVNLRVNEAPAALVLSNCRGTSSTVEPQAASWQCTLINNGGVASSISYNVTGGLSVSTEPSSCAGNGATCGTVFVETPTAAGQYNGTLTVTPNSGSGASMPISLSVQYAPTQLEMYNCEVTSPTTEPTPATRQCKMRNHGRPTSSITYDATGGLIAPTTPSSCAGYGADCGTVIVKTPNTAGQYDGILTANPNTGASTSQAISLQVIAPLTVSASPAVLYNNIVGNGVASGSTNITVSGGKAPYSYSWARTAGSRGTISDPNSNNPTFSASLSSGEEVWENWTLIVKDANNATASLVESMSFKSAAPEIPVSIFVHPSVATGSIEGSGTAQAQIAMTASNGSPPYTFSWPRLTGSRISVALTNTETSSVALFGAAMTEGESLSEQFTATVVDSKGAVSNKNVTVTLTAKIPVTVTLDSQTLTANIVGAGTVSATGRVTVKGGAAPYTVTWARTNGAASTISSVNSETPTFSASLNVGQSISETWAVTVVDAENNRRTANLSINFSSKLPLPTLDVQMISKPDYAVIDGTVWVGTTFARQWKATNATSVSYNCDAPGTGYKETQYLMSRTKNDNAEGETTTQQAKAEWIDFPSSCIWTLEGEGGTITKTETIKTAIQLIGVLQLEQCVQPTPVIHPSTLVMSCQLKNVGNDVINSIQYTATSGLQVEGPTGVCQAQATCGAVTVKMTRYVESYDGNITLTPNRGKLVTKPIQFTSVLSTALKFGQCTYKNDVMTPGIAEARCPLTNVGFNAAKTIQYQAPTGVEITGPQSCGYTYTETPTSCGEVLVRTLGPAGHYQGPVTATPDSGFAASFNLDLNVRPLTPAGWTYMTHRTPAIAGEAISLDWRINAGSVSKNAQLSCATTDGIAVLAQSLSGVVGQLSIPTQTAWANKTVYCEIKAWNLDGDTTFASGDSILLEPMTQETPVLSLSNCEIKTLTHSPEPASYTCQLRNHGRAPITNISAERIGGMEITAPTSCAAATASDAAQCGTVKVVTDTVDTTYTGVLKLVPNVGRGILERLTLVVNPVATKSVDASLRLFPNNPAAGKNFTVYWTSTNASGTKMPSLYCGKTEGQLSVMLFNLTLPSMSGDLTFASKAEWTGSKGYCTIVVYPDNGGDPISRSIDFQFAQASTHPVTVNASTDPADILVGEKFKIKWATTYASTDPEYSTRYSCASENGAYNEIRYLTGESGEVELIADEKWAGKQSRCTFWASSQDNSELAINYLNLDFKAKPIQATIDGNFDPIKPVAGQPFTIKWTTTNSSTKTMPNIMCTSSDGGFTDVISFTQPQGSMDLVAGKDWGGTHSQCRFTVFTQYERAGTGGFKTLDIEFAGQSHANLVLRNCQVTTNVKAPAQASVICDMRNSGALDATQIVYTPDHGAQFSNPPATCAAYTECGKVQLTVAQVGHYQGINTIIANINAKGAAVIQNELDVLPADGSGGSTPGTGGGSTPVPKLIGETLGIRSTVEGKLELHGWACLDGSAQALQYSVYSEASSKLGGKLLATGTANIASENNNLSIANVCHTPGVGHSFVLDVSSYAVNNEGKPLFVEVKEAAGSTILELLCVNNNCTMPGTIRIGLTTPQHNDRFVAPGEVFMQALISNTDAAIDTVAFNIDGEWITAQADGKPNTYFAKKSGLAGRAEAYPVTARVKQGNTTLTTTEKLIYVDGFNKDINITLTAPLGNATLQNGVATDLAATVTIAQTSTVPVAAVKFQYNGTPIATATKITNGNWTAKWTPATTGSGKLTAQVLDVNGVSLGLSSATLVNVVVPSSLPLEPASLTPVELEIPYSKYLDAGSLPGDIQIDNSGNSTYKISIMVPPGSAGFTPNLALVYQSSFGNGIAGLGWNLVGGSTIKRCIQTIAQDGAPSAIKLDSTDPLCVDGNRLILISGVHGQVGASYRTEIDNFARITAISGVGGQVAYKVETKDQRIMTYGTTSDSAIAVVGRYDGNNNLESISAPLSWELTKIEDRYLNQIEYSYSQDAVTGESLLTAIRYGNKERLYNRIDFAYECRNNSSASNCVGGDEGDAETIYIAGARNDRRKRLTSITTYTEATNGGTGGVVVQTTKLDYKRSTTSYRSLLASVTTCGNDGVCLPSTKFDWGASTGTNAFVSKGVLNGGPPSDYGSFPGPDGGQKRVIDYQKIIGSTPTGDFVGDGKQRILTADLVGWHTYTVNSSKTGFDVTDYPYSSNPNLPVLSFGMVDDIDGNGHGILGSGGGLYEGPKLIADFDGDGASDVAYLDSSVGRVGTNNWIVCLSRPLNLPAAFDCKQFGSSLIAEMSMIGTRNSMTIDVNADGRSEVVLWGSRWTTNGVVKSIDDQRCRFVPSVGANSNDWSWECSSYEGVFSAVINSPPPLNPETANDFWSLAIANQLNLGMANSSISKTVVGDFFGSRQSSLIAQREHYSSLDATTAINTGSDLFVRIANDTNFNTAPVGKRNQFVWSDDSAKVDSVFKRHNLAGVEYGGTPLGDLNQDGYSDYLFTFADHAEVCYSNGLNGFVCNLLFDSTPATPSPTKLQLDGSVINGSFEVYKLLSLGQVHSNVLSAVYRRGGRDYKVCVISDAKRQCVDWQGPQLMGDVACPSPSIPCVGNNLSAPNVGTLVGDFSGSGKIEILWYANNSNGRSTAELGFGWQLFTPNTSGPTDKLVHVTNGYGSNTSIQYALMSDPDVYTRLPADGTRLQYPKRLVQDNSRFLVKSISTDNGQGRVLTTSYRYEGLAVNLQGRGELGFQRVHVMSPLGTSQSTYLSQEFPTNGMPLELKTTSSTNVLLGHQKNTLDVLSTSGVKGTAFYPYVKSSGMFVQADLNGRMLPLTTTNNSLDVWGNLLTQDVVTTGAVGSDWAGKTYTTSTSNTYDNFPISGVYRIGELRRATVKKSAPGQPDIIQIKTYDYTVAADGAEGLVKKAVIEPDDVKLRVTTDYARDGYGNITTTTQTWVDPISATPQSKVFSSTFDTLGRFPEKTTAPCVGVCLSETQQFDAGTGKMKRKTDANGLVTQWLIDGLGRTIKQIHPDLTETRFFHKQCNGACPVMGSVAVTYDENFKDDKRINVPSLKFSDSVGHLLRTQSWGLKGNITIIDQRFDNYGRVREVDNPRFDNATAYLGKRVDHDELGRVIAETALNEKGVELITEFVYDGETTQIKSPKKYSNSTQAVKREQRNPLGQLAKTIDAAGGVTTFDRDAFGNLNKTTDPAGNVVTITYDKLGRKTDLNDPDLGWIHYDLDPLGRILKQTNPNERSLNKPTVFQYDKLDRMISRSEAHLESRWIFDVSPGVTDCQSTKSCGKLIEADTIVAGIKDYVRLHNYDGFARLTTTTTKLDLVTYTSRNYYDDWGRLLQTTEQRGVGSIKGFHRRYNNFGYLSSIQHDSDTAHPLGYVLWKASEVYASGSIAQAKFGNGLQTDRTLNPYSNRLTRGTISSVVSGKTLIGDDYTYDGLGNVDNRSHYWNYTDGSQKTFIEDFHYDDLNRLIDSQVSGSPMQSFTYDAIGNIKSKTGLGVFTYPNAGAARPHAQSTIDSLGAFTYDDNGNLKTGAGRNYTWTNFDMPSRIQSATQSSDFIYGPEHQRIRQNRGDGSTVWYAGSMEVETKNNATTVKTYWPQGLGVEIETPDGVTTYNWTHTDHLGSVMGISDEGGLQLERLSYDPWGKRRTLIGDATPDSLDGQIDNKGYTGHEMLDRLDLIHMNGRIYDPVTARFVSADPYIQDPLHSQSYNRYAYVWNNPMNMVDPSGFNGAGAGAQEIIIRPCTFCQFEKDFSSARRFLSQNALRIFDSITTVAVGTSRIAALPLTLLFIPGNIGQKNDEDAWLKKRALEDGLRKKASPLKNENAQGDTSDESALDGANSEGKKGDREGSGFPDRELPRDPNGNPVRDPEAEGAHTQLGQKGGRRGKYDQGREWDANGRPVKDIDFTDHGRPQNHTNPHEHPYLPNPTGGTPQHGPARPLKN